MLKQRMLGGVTTLQLTSCYPKSSVKSDQGWGVPVRIFFHTSTTSSKYGHFWPPKNKMATDAELQASKMVWWMGDFTVGVLFAERWHDL